MSAPTVTLQESTITEYCKRLQLPTVRSHFSRLAQEAAKQNQTHPTYLEEFDFEKAPHIPVFLIRSLAEGDYLKRSEPVLLLGEAGTGKTHLATGLAVAACRQRKRVRFTTAAGLINELIEAKNQNELNRVTNRWTRFDLVVIDEMAYVTIPESAAELLFQVIAGRAERSAVIITTNLPFSEWTTMFPNARLCKAMLDRLTDQAHIIETGNESYRFRRTLEKRKGGKK
jgi:DNA replication protein DnaC